MAARPKKKAPAKKIASGRGTSPHAGEAVSRPFAKLGQPAKGKPAKISPRVAVPAPPVASAKNARAATPDSFAHHMGDVKKLPKKALRIPATVSELEEIPVVPIPPAWVDDGERGHSPEHEALDRLVIGALRFELVDDGALLEGRRLDVDPRELRKLRTQRYTIDGKLDLHGQSLEGARVAVERFVERRRMQGDRAILVVHGKGLHSSRGEAVLRGELGAWLSQGRAAKDVLAFASLEDESGGSGALMVLLAKR